jgi:TP901 family phage tail tape measure protein
MVADIFARFGADTSGFQKDMRAAVTRMLFAAESFTQAGRIMTTAITAPMAAIGVASLKTAMQFESAMVRMETLVGMQASAMAGWREEVKRMAGEVGKSAVELAEALFFITSAGVRDAQALDVLRFSAKAAAVGLGQTKDVAFAAVSAMNAYGQANLKAGDAVAVLIRTVREGNVQAETLPMAFGRLLPIAAAMGIEFHEAGAGIAAMTQAGVSARLAAFGLRAVMLSLLAPTKGARKAAEQMGLSFDHLARVAREEGLIYALQQMAAAADAHGRSLKDLIPSHRAFTAALQLVGENAENVQTIFNNLSEATERDVNQTFERAAQTAEVTLAQAMGKLSSAAIDLGENLAFAVDMFAGLADRIAKGAALFNEMPNWFKDASIAIGGFVFAIGPVLYALGSLARMTARFTGLSILFQAAWARKTGAMLAGVNAAEVASAKFKILGVSIGTFSASVISAFTIGFQFGQLLDDWIGITDKLNKKFGEFKDTATEIASVYENNSEVMNTAVDAAMKLAHSIGAVTEAEVLSQVAFEGNTKMVSHQIRRINELAAAYNKAHIKVEGLTEAEQEAARKREQEAEALRLADEQNQQYVEGLKDTYDLLTGPEVLENLQALVRHERELTEQTGNRKVVLEKMKDKIKEQLEWAKKYNLELPEGILTLYEALKKEGIVAQGEWDHLFERIDEHVDATPGKFIDGMIKVGDEVATQLKGGFSRGFAEGIDQWTAHDQQLQGALNATLRGGFGKGFDGFRTEVQGIVDEMNANPLEVAIVPNKDIWVQFFYDLADGRYPDTGG